MGKLIPFKSVPKPIDLDNRKEKLACKRAETKKKYADLKQKGKDLYNK